MSKFSKDTEYICPVFASSAKCEQDALKVMEQFKDFYEGKLSEVDVQGGGDCLETKLKIQRRWIEDLTEQTQMMARIVKELEDEATARVCMLEDKLKHTSKNAYEVMKRYQAYSISQNLDEPFQKVFYMENDLKNLLEFVRRIREDKAWSIDGLQFYDINHKDLFGNKHSYELEDDKSSNINHNCTNAQEAPPSDDTARTVMIDNTEQMTDMLKKKDEEFAELRRAMLDMRTALTEEVACKHDMISTLRKDIQQLEERCLQSDKQTAFKDDIIKELRKEIKQLKQQNQEKEAKLEKQLEEAKKKIKRMKPCVDTSTKCTDMDDQAVIKKSKLIQNKDDIIQIQNDTLNVIELELQAARRREKELEEEINSRQTEVDDLKLKCTDLEAKLTNCEGCAENLQSAVDLYVNSVNVLEAAEEKSRIEIEQQKMTIANLQEALLNVKQELDDLKQNSQQEMGYYQYLCNVFYVNIIDLEARNKTLENDLSKIRESYKKLQDCSFELEVEHFSSLQDLAIFETQLYKYQGEFRNYEEIKSAAKIEIKKLRQQVQYYEHTCECFKQEMTVMAEQLGHLQDILNLSNKSCKEENGQLYNAIHEAQKLNEKLQAELNDTEKKALMENQKNQLKDAKIDELQLIVGQKNADLNLHDEAINEMKMRLDHYLVEKHQLQATIASLNTTVMELECSIKIQRVESSKRTRSKTVACRRSHSDCRSDSEKRHRRDTESYETGKLIQKEIERVKEKNKEKIRKLKHINEELKQKLAADEVSNKRLHEQIIRMKKEVAKVSENQCEKDHELAQSKQIIIEMRQTLIELNESLAENELHQMILVEEYHKQTQEKSQQEDIYLSCRCEIALYKKLAENFQTALVDARRNMCECEAQIKLLTEEMKIKETRFCDLQKKSAKKEKEACQCIEELNEKLKIKETKICEIQKKAAKKEKETCQCIEELNEQLKIKETKICEIQKKAAKKEKESCQCIEELNEKLKESKAEEHRMCEFVENMKMQVQKKMESKKEPAVSPQKVVVRCCNCTTMNATQEEIESLKVEIKNMIQNQLELNLENDKLLQQVNCLQTTIQTVEEKNYHLKQKLEKLQAEYLNVKEKNKVLVREKESYLQTVKTLEYELSEAKSNRDDLCNESRCVVNNVKAWLEEQKKINDQVMKRAQCYCDTIKQLKQENESLLCAPPLVTSTPYKPRYPKKYGRVCTDVDYQSKPRYGNNYERCYADTDTQHKSKYGNNYESFCTDGDCQDKPRYVANYEQGCTEANCENIWGLGSQAESPRDSPMSCACSMEEWYSPNYRDEEETEENEFIDQIEAVTNEMRNTNKKWKNRQRRNSPMPLDE